MGLLHQINHWSATHHPRWLVFPRVALGLSLFVKGISFMQSRTDLESLVAQISFGNFSSWIALTVTWLHLLGGFLIIIGLLTRLAVALQIPILIGAVFLINQQTGSEFMFALAILLLLIFFFFEGGGPLSLDNFFAKYEA